MRITTVLAVVTAGFTTIANAQTEREHGSHEHGSAALNIAIDDGTVFLELETPWNNLVGFEHDPSTEEQHTLVDNALAQLNQPEQLFSFTGGGCVAAEAAVESDIEESHDDHHEHDDEHHDADGDKHDEHHDDHGKDEETHSEVLATYTFTCTDVASVSVIDVTLLKVWSGFEDLDVQLIGPGGQAAVELNPEKTAVDIAGVQ